MRSPAFIGHFYALDDSGQARKGSVRCPTVCCWCSVAPWPGAEDFAGVERWGRRKLDFLRRLPPFPRGFQSHDMLTDMSNTLPAQLF